jgi:hypothetical protein
MAGWELVGALRSSPLSDGVIAVELPDNPVLAPRRVRSGTITETSDGIPIYAAMLARSTPVLTEPPLGPWGHIDFFHGEAPSVSRISLGVPQSVELTHAPVGDVTGLSDFLGATDAIFILVHLGCSFMPAAGQRFVRASLRLAIRREDGMAERAPVAWSMEPRCLPQVTELSRTQKVDASLKVFSVSVGQEQRSTRARCLIRAYNELQSDPRWEFRRTKGAEIVGTQRLIVVVSTTVRAIVRITLTAELQRGRLPMRRRRMLAVGRVHDLWPPMHPRTDPSSRGPMMQPGAPGTGA